MKSVDYMGGMSKEQWFTLICSLDHKSSRILLVEGIKREDVIKVNTYSIGLVKIYHGASGLVNAFLIK